MSRRAFITLLGAVASWPLAVRAQNPGMPLVALVSGRSPEVSARHAAAFRKGLNEAGYIEGQNVTVEYYWLAGQYDRLPSLMADLVRRRVAVIATTVLPGAQAAKAATATIPIVFGVPEDPGQVASSRQSRPPGRQCDRRQFFPIQSCGQAALWRWDLLRASTFWSTAVEKCSCDAHGALCDSRGLPPSRASRGRWVDELWTDLVDMFHHWRRRLLRPRRAHCEEPHRV
jgi:hypothetical protein